MKPATFGSLINNGQRLRLICEECQHCIERDPADFARSLGDDVPVRSIIPRLKCQRCGSRDCTVQVASEVPDMGRYPSR